MTPLEIIQQFQLDTTTNKDDFLIAADWADDHNLPGFAHLLRHDTDFLMRRQSPPELSITSKHPNAEIGCGYGGDQAYYGAYGFQLPEGQGFGSGEGLFQGRGYGEVLVIDDGSGAGPGYGDAHMVGTLHPAFHLRYPSGSGSGGQLDEFYKLGNTSHPS